MILQLIYCCIVAIVVCLTCFMLIGHQWMNKSRSDQDKGSNLIYNVFIDA